MFYTLPPIPAKVEECLLPEVEGEGSCGDPRIGMMVDTTLVPYGFRVTVVDQVVNCWIYDSNSGAWTPGPSADVYTTSNLCFRHSEPLYMKVVDEIVPTYRFHFYELEGDECECCPEPGVLEVVWEYGDIGRWQDRWFVFAEEPRSVLTVWEISTEISTENDEPLFLFDYMPNDLCDWILRGSPSAQSKLCGEHAIVYKCVGYEEKAVLYNLDRKTWDKIELPQLPPSQ